MALRFEGLSDLEWKLFEDLLPQSLEKRGRGMPHVPFRKVLNTQLYVLITGCRWCDIPRGEQWASKSSAHRWQGRWYEDGTLEKLKRRILAVAEEKGMIDWKYRLMALFPPLNGGGKGVAYGYKGKGILIHSITDANGMPLVAITTPEEW